MTWSADGSLLVSADQNGIFFFDPLSRQKVRELYPQATPIVNIEFSPAGSWLVSASREGTEESGYFSRIELWQGPGWKPRGLIYDVPLAISDIAFSPDGTDLTAAFSSPIAERNELDFWDVTYWVITETLQTSPLLNIAISPDGEQLASSPDLYALKVMDLGEKSWIYELRTSFTGTVNAWLPEHIASIAHLRSRGVTIRTSEEVKDIMVSDGRAAGVATQRGAYSARRIILAPGRVGADWMGTIAQKFNLGLTQRAIEVGVRVEVHNDILQDLCEVIYDPTFFIQTAKYDDLPRTFCTNRGGFVSLENYSDFVCVNGHAYRERKSENTNSAFLSKVVLTEPVTDNQSYGEAIGRNKI